MIFLTFFLIKKNLNLLALITDRQTDRQTDRSLFCQRLLCSMEVIHKK